MSLFARKNNYVLSYLDVTREGLPVLHFYKTLGQTNGLIFQLLLLLSHIQQGFGSALYSVSLSRCIAKMDSRDPGDDRWEKTFNFDHPGSKTEPANY